MARFLQQLLRRLSGPRPKAVAALWLAACIAVLAGCEEIEEDKPWIHVDRPQMLFTDTTLLDCYDKDVLSWKMKTAYLERWADKEVIFVRPVLVDIYDSVGERVAFLRADSRVVSEDGDVLQGKGFESDAHMDNWRILSNVTGIFQDAAKRMKEEDKKQAEELEKKPPAPPPAARGPVPGAAGASPATKGASTVQSPPQRGNK